MSLDLTFIAYEQGRRLADRFRGLLGENSLEWAADTLQDNAMRLARHLFESSMI